MILVTSSTSSYIQISRLRAFGCYFKQDYAKGSWHRGSKSNFHFSFLSLENVVVRTPSTFIQVWLILILTDASCNTIAITKEKFYLEWLLSYKALPHSSDTFIKSTTYAQKNIVLFSCNKFVICIWQRKYLF